MGSGFGLCQMRKSNSNGVDELEEYFLYQIFKIELADGAIESLHPITSELELTDGQFAFVTQH